MKLAYAGSYGLIVTPDYIKGFDDVLVLRRRATQMPKAYVQETFSYIGENLHFYSLLYSGRFGYLLATTRLGLWS